MLQRVEQATHRAVSSVALRGQQHRWSLHQPAERREHPCQLVELDVEVLHLAAIERRQVVIERIGEQAEGLTRLELGGPPSEHEVAAPLGLDARFGHGPRLADALLASDLEDPLGGELESVERASQRLQLDPPPDQDTGALGHRQTLCPVAASSAPSVISI